MLQLFSDKDTVDDLGIGTVRDAISNSLFPGTSVIQTRARYFLFVPWLFRRAEQRYPQQLVAKATDMERNLIEALRADGDLVGLIGVDRGKNVRTLPSAIFWGGLIRYGIFLSPSLSIRQYGRHVARGFAWWTPRTRSPIASHRSGSARSRTLRPTSSSSRLPPSSSPATRPSGCANESSRQIVQASQPVCLLPISATSAAAEPRNRRRHVAGGTPNRYGAVHRRIGPARATVLLRGPRCGPALQPDAGRRAVDRTSKPRRHLGR